MIETINSTLTNIYLSLKENVPDTYKPLVVIIFYTIIIAAYAVFMWKFYKFLAKRNILELNLSQYNKTEHPFWDKFLASCLFLLEYIIIIPIVVFFWFSVFSIFILLLSEIPSLNQILMISTAIIAATRLIAYYNSELAEEVVGVFPISLLVVLLLEPNFFSASKLITRFSEIPSLLNNIFIYLFFIIVLEILMRGLFTLFELIFSSNE